MSETNFQIEQKVVYPSQGVGVVKEIFTKNFKGVDIPYYKIYIESSDMIVMIPVDKAEGLGIRPIVSAEEAQKALDLLSDDFEPITSDWKLRYQMNLDLLKKGTISDIAAIVRCLYNRSKIKELPILERKLYDNAKKLLEDEVSIAMDKPLKEVESTIHTKLEPPGAAIKVKKIIEDEDDEDDSLMDDVNSDSKSSRSRDNSDDDDSDDQDEAGDMSNDDYDDGADDEEF
ncbi:MAG: CarD family transcriptional regulator [Treponema sp.]|nr:CarD family transcriptional regulator [Treponema sp.]